MKRLIQFILIALMLCLTTLLIQITYAKYRDRIKGPIESEIASWNIKVNNESINNKTTLENSITPTFTGNDYTKEGVLAPGTEGYFDIIIDATEADVSFDYEISVEKDEDSSIPDLITTGYQLEGQTSQELTGNITGTITHNTESTSIRVFIKWDDSETNTMDNETDTNVAISDEQNTKIMVSIKFTQKK